MSLFGSDFSADANLRFPSPLLDEQVAAGLRGDLKRGREIADILKKQTPWCQRAAFNRAWYEMMDGNLLEGFKLLDNGRFQRVFGDQPLPTSKSIWRNEDLKNKKLLLCSEGGLGDEIINARFAQDFAERGAHVTLTADQSLMSVFARIPGVHSVVDHKMAPHVYHDFWVPAMSAGRVLELEYKDLKGTPFMSADPLYAEKWRRVLTQKFGNLPKIGLRFYGNPQFEHEQHRRFPRELLINATGGRQWINLQLEDKELPIENWEDTLGIIANLELVITSCTSVAHASLAMGKPTWVVVPILPYYIWALPGNSSPWYKTVKLYRQTKFKEWADVFENIARDLNQLFAKDR